MEPVLRKQAADLGLEKRVHFCGFRKDMVGCYNSIDLVIQASYTEGMPNVILEALVMGIPVIATDVGGTGEIINDGISGRLMPAASTTINTSSGPGSGTGRSPGTSTSGPPLARASMTVMVCGSISPSFSDGVLLIGDDVREERRAMLG